MNAWPFSMAGWRHGVPLAFPKPMGPMRRRRWRRIPRPVSIEPASPVPTRCRRAWGEAPGWLFDARGGERFRGEVEPIDPVAGHVPGALNRPFAANLRDGRFRSAEELRGELVPLLHGRQPAEAVLMCGSGVTACHLLLAMEHAGLAGAKVYAGSWSGWIADPARPVATGM